MFWWLLVDKYNAILQVKQETENRLKWRDMVLYCLAQKEVDDVARGCMTGESKEIVIGVETTLSKT